MRSKEYEGAVAEAEVHEFDEAEGEERSVDPVVGPVHGNACFASCIAVNECEYLQNEIHQAEVLLVELDHVVSRVDHVKEQHTSMVKQYKVRVEAKSIGNYLFPSKIIQNKFWRQ